MGVCFSGVNSRGSSKMEHNMENESAPTKHDRDEGETNNTTIALQNGSNMHNGTVVSDMSPPKSLRAERRLKRRRQVQSLLRIGSQRKQTDTGSVVAASTYNDVHKLVHAGVLDRIRGDASSGRSASFKGVVGFQNLGNTCFMNSSIQCLSNTIPLADYFLGYDFRKEINRSNVLGTGGALVLAYADLMKEIWLGSNAVLTPRDFKNRLEQFAPQFAGGYQHDAQEFLSFLLDGIHEDLNRVQNKPYIEDIEGDGNNDEGDSMKSWQNYLMRNKSVVVDIFQGQLRTTLQCGVCSKTVVKFDPFMYLSLPLSKNTQSLDDCLNLFCQEESLNGDNQWYCPKCKKHVDATTRTDLWTLPPILIVHLKRFKQDRSGRCTKIKQGVKFKIKGWDLDDFVARHTMASPLYDLFAVSNHHGNFGSGHYTAFAINRVDDKWYNFNDSHASTISEEQVEKNDDAYVLFFNRVVDTFDGASEEDGDDAEASLGSSRAPVIVRQSVNRPEHWPHLMTNETLRNYKRGPSIQPVPSSPERTEGISEGDAEKEEEATISSTNDVSTPSQHENIPLEDSSTPSQHKNISLEDLSTPSQHENISLADSSTPSQHENIPLADSTTSSKNENIPAKPEPSPQHLETITE